MSTEGYIPLQKILNLRDLSISCYDDRPSHLFTGLDKNTLSVILVGQKNVKCKVFSTRLIRWKAEERPILFETLSIAKSPECKLAGCFPKIGSNAEQKIWDNLHSVKNTINLRLKKHGRFTTHYSRKINSFIQVLNFVPEVRNAEGEIRPPSEFKPLTFSLEEESISVFCTYNSSLFRWFLDVTTDGSHLNKREVQGFPMNLENLISGVPKLIELGKDLSESLKETSETRVMKYKHDTLTIQCIVPKYAKPIIDQIDTVLAQHYSFTEEELDFIINYDIKYRMGKALFGEDDNGEDE